MEDIKQDPIGYITRVFEATKQWRQPYEDRWKRFYKLYRSYRDPSQYTLKSNVFVPYTFSIVETVVPKMLGTIFNTRPILSVVPRHGTSEGMARLLESLLQYQLDEEQLEFFNKVLEFFKETAIYGTSFAKVIPKFNDDDLVSFNFIDMEPIDLFNIYPDFRAKSVRRMKYIIQVSYMEYDELLEKYRQGFYEKVPELIDKVESMINIDEFKRRRLSSVGILDEYGFDSNRKIIEVIEYWDKDNIYVIGGRSVVMKKEVNPFQGLLPFIMARYVPVQHELFGIGIPEISESLQDELNAVRNQRMDNVNLIINRMFVANKYADIDFDNMISYPGNIILTNDVNAIVPLNTPDVTKSAYNEEEIIKLDIDNATGEFAYNRGAPPERRETATGIVRLQQASNIRFDTVVKMLEFTVLRSIAKMFIWLDYHFLEPKDFAKIVGEDEFVQNDGMSFYKQDIEELLKQFHFQPMGSSTTAVKEVRVQQIMQAFSMFNQDPMINQMELRKMVLDALDIKSVNKLLQTPPPPPPPTMPTPQTLPGGQVATEGAPQPPQPPQPGTPPTLNDEQLMELLKASSGQLAQGAGPQPTPPNMVGAVQ